MNKKTQDTSIVEPHLWDFLFQT